MSLMKLSHTHTPLGRWKFSDLWCNQVPLINSIWMTVCLSLNDNEEWGLENTAVEYLLFYTLFSHFQSYFLTAHLCFTTGTGKKDSVLWKQPTLEAAAAALFRPCNPGSLCFISALLSTWFYSLLTPHSEQRPPPRSHSLVLHHFILLMPADRTGS